MTTNVRAIKVEVAEFQFATHKVVFVGAKVIVYEWLPDPLSTWNRCGELDNKWTSKADDDGHVMGRFWKPRLTDALDCLRQISRPKPEPKKPRRSRPLKIHEPVD